MTNLVSQFQSIFHKLSKKTPAADFHLVAKSSESYKTYTPGSFVYKDSIDKCLLGPVDPLLLLRQEADLVESLALSFFDRDNFQKFIFPCLFAWAAFIQSIPRSANGILSENNGFLKAGLIFAKHSLLALEHRVVGPELAPISRSDWITRMRASVLLTGLISDIELINDLQLEVGTITTDTNEFHSREIWHPTEESAFEFTTRHVGRWGRLFRSRNEKPNSHLSTLAADAINLIVIKETRLWLSQCQLEDGETALAALRNAVVFNGGLSKSSSMIADCVSEGRSFAIDKITRHHARTLGQAPLYVGFIDRFKTLVKQAILTGRWKINQDKGIVVWTKDGVFLKWPAAFSKLKTKIGNQCKVPDDIESTAYILADAGLIEKKDGEPSFQLPENPLGTATVVQLTNTYEYVHLIHETLKLFPHSQVKPLEAIFPQAISVKDFDAKELISFSLNPELTCRNIEIKLNRKLTSLEKKAVRYLANSIRRISNLADNKKYFTQHGLFVVEENLDPALHTEERLTTLGLVKTRTFSFQSYLLQTTRETVWWEVQVRDTFEQYRGIIVPFYLLSPQGLTSDDACWLPSDSLKVL